MTNYGRFKTIKSIKVPLIDKTYACVHCGGDVRVRNPQGNCDHLYYPENCDECKRMYIKEKRKSFLDKFYERFGWKRV